MNVNSALEVIKLLLLLLLLLLYYYIIILLKITRDELPVEWGVYGGCLPCPLYPLLSVFVLYKLFYTHNRSKDTGHLNAKSFRKCTYSERGGSHLE